MTAFVQTIHTVPQAIVAGLLVIAVGAFACVAVWTLFRS